MKYHKIKNRFDVGRFTVLHIERKKDKYVIVNRDAVGTRLFDGYRLKFGHSKSALAIFNSWDLALTAAKAMMNYDEDIPWGKYCYEFVDTSDGRIRRICKYWSLKDDTYGSCAFLNIDDQTQGGWTALFNQTKECGINRDSDSEEELLMSNTTSSNNVSLTETDT